MRKSIRLIGVVIGLVVLILAVAGYLFLTRKKAVTPLIPVTIAFQQWVGYGPLYLARDLGFMKKEGIDLIIVDEQLDSARRDAFKQGILDFEAGTLDLLVSKASQETPVEAVMEIDHSAGSDGIVADEKIKSLADLYGKRVALSRDDVGETFISTLFYQNGITMAKVNLVPKSPDEIAQTFLNGETDAAVTWEPQLSAALKRPGSHLLATTREHQDIIIDTLNVRKDLATDRPDVVKKVIRGWFAALNYYQKNPTIANTIIAPYFKISPVEYKAQVGGLFWEDFEHQTQVTEIEEMKTIFNTIQEVKILNGRINHKSDPNTFINHSFLETLYENSR